MRCNKKRLLSCAAALSLAVIFTGAVTPANAQNVCQDDSGPSSTLDPRVAQTLQTVFENMTAELYQEALVELNELIARRGDSMKAFDRATTYELRGSVRANLEDFSGALRDFQTALDSGGLPTSRNNQLRYFIAQLHFQEENYQAAISGLNQWIQFARQCDQAVDPSAYYLLAAAYTQITPPNWRAAIGPAEQAKAAAPSPNKGYYDLLNLIYSELGDEVKRRALLEEMVNYWPGYKMYWVQLSGAYSQAGQDRDAFSTLEVAYRAGLLDKESELVNLVQYYSFYNNPYRGAKLLEREMAAGNIERDQENLVLLSQLWSQSREHKRSIPILREAARGANDGELYYRLGQVLLADEQYAAAEAALQNALNRGGMDRDNTGDSWLLLGTARFNQAGPDDLVRWRSAREAFVNAMRYDKPRRQASAWLQYVDAVIDTYVRGKEREKIEAIETCRDELDRIQTAERIEELQGRQPSSQEAERRAQVQAECETILAEADNVEEN